MENFSIHLVSSASMDVFKNNTLASFCNQLAQPLQLEGKWQVALESIIFPANIKNVTSTLIKEYPKSDLAQFPFNVDDNNIEELVMVIHGALLKVFIKMLLIFWKKLKLEQN